MCDRIKIIDNFPVIKYWTPAEYSQKYPYLDKVKVNEEVDCLNGAIYREAIEFALEQKISCGQIKYHHIYGLLGS